MSNIARAAAGFRELPEESNPYSKEGIEAFRKSIAELKNQLVEQAGRLEFAESDAKMRLANIQLQGIENQKFAAQIKKLETEIDIFVLKHTTAQKTLHIDLF